MCGRSSKWNWEEEEIFVGGGRRGVLMAESGGVRGVDLVGLERGYGGEG